MSSSDENLYRGDPPSAPPPPPPGQAPPGYAQQGYPPPGYPPPGYAPPGYPPPGYAPPGYAPPGYPPPGYAGMGYGGQAVRPTNTMAVLALVFAFVFPPAAIVLGVLARRQIRETGEQGDGLALAGIIVGGIATAMFALMIIGMIAAFSTATSYGY